MMRVFFTELCLPCRELELCGATIGSMTQRQQALNIKPECERQCPTSMGLVGRQRKRTPTLYGSLGRSCTVYRTLSDRLEKRLNLKAERLPIGELRPRVRYRCLKPRRRLVLPPVHALAIAPHVLVRRVKRPIRIVFKPLRAFFRCHAVAQ